MSKPTLAAVGATVARATVARATVARATGAVGDGAGLDVREVVYGGIAR